MRTITLKIGEIELFISYFYSASEPETGFTGGVEIHQIQWVKSIHILGSEIINITPIFNQFVQPSTWQELCEEIKSQIEQPII